MSGAVYLIKCSETDKVYVGSSREFDRRKDAHEAMLRDGRHHSIHLQRAYDRHGAEAFSIQIVEAVDDVVFLRAREQMWINRLGSDNLYNVSFDATAGSRTPAQMEAHRQRMIGNTFRRGQTMPAEYCAAQAEKMKGNSFRSGIPHPETDKQKISAGLKRAYENGRTRASGFPIYGTIYNAKVKAEGDARKARFLELDAPRKPRKELADQLGISLDTVSHYRELKKKGLL